MSVYDYDDDHGPLDSPHGDSEADHVWADLARSEQEPPEHMDEDGDSCRRCGAPDVRGRYCYECGGELPLEPFE